MHRDSIAPLALWICYEHAIGGYHRRLGSAAPLELSNNRSHDLRDRSTSQCWLSRLLITRVLATIGNQNRYIGMSVRMKQADSRRAIASSLRTFFRSCFAAIRGRLLAISCSCSVE
jgi:hypothetical protein